ncbi:TolC family protein [Pseudosulfitobacter pseudonitzschiae]|uniref:TolC family protein n=1 Tax=Pseudosulfitobacter pseudonitzschiae TaxID=1402135 RepID=UPI001AFB14CA|nr:TolC family protein [Pseudosulfitobacter pseudonitzschiae]MBM1814544.1 TolC family protein [Pseudosulfitobacter pseudonitzschiae]MBM1831538.1 TolC family protein [Pseudosulfitobacter pseudonitzschiae]MBM1836403.1 TolC family protein [Pseudosulfitobacter pseudonitzschiae]MBM1841250.1 TolC family protein [Pseudosulfitobacter pseudonitzschiae]MBM1846117.1 TolC family protein [Pseudosulfitobacter pseudonitzschiae]
MGRFKSPLILGGALVLGACATTVPDIYIGANPGFADVASQTQAAIGKRAVFAQSQAENKAVQKEVTQMVYRKTISAERAVQVALLNNRGLQASYANVGLSAAEAWQQSTPENPVVSIGLLGIGAAELGAYRAIEGMIATNILDAKTRKQRMALADVNFRAAQLMAVNDTLALAHQTRRAWIEAVAAFEAVGHLNRALATSDAGSELARKLGETGALGRAGQAREQAFNAELAGQLAQARLGASRAKENLTRLMGLWGADVEFYVPDALPPLPRSAGQVANVESKALRNRVDLRVAKLGLEAQAAAFGLTDQTRLVTDLEIIAGFETEREAEGGDVATSTTPQLELEFAIPIYDSGKARMRKAELAYLQAANVLAEKAVNVRSEARGAEVAYHASYKIARHYRDVLVPLRKTVEDEGLLSYNGMITSTFELLTDVREKLGAQMDAANAKRDFYMAQADLTAAIYGGGADNSGGTEGGATLAAAGGAGH